MGSTMIATGQNRACRPAETSNSSLLEAKLCELKVLQQTAKSTGNRE